MNFLDIIIIAAVVIFGLLGAYSGLLRQLSTPAALIGAWMFSWMVERPVSEQLASWFASDLVAQYAAAAIAFSLSFLIIKIVWAVISARIAANHILKPGNRALGAVLGVIKGLALSCLAVLLFVHLGKEELRTQSVCAETVYDGYLWLSNTDFYRKTKEELTAVLENHPQDNSFKAGAKRFWEDKVKTLPQKIRFNDDPPPAGTSPAANG